MCFCTKAYHEIHCQLSKVNAMQHWVRETDLVVTSRAELGSWARRVWNNSRKLVFMQQWETVFKLRCKQGPSTCQATLNHKAAVTSRNTSRLCLCNNVQLTGWSKGYTADDAKACIECQVMMVVLQPQALILSHLLQSSAWLRSVFIPTLKGLLV